MALKASDFTVTNATDSDKADLDRALSYLDKDTTGTASALMQQIASKGVTINIVHDGDDRYIEATKTINWDPKSPSTVITNPNGGSTYIDGVSLTVGVQSAALGLAHEAAHATDPNPLSVQNTRDPNYDTLAEKYAVGVENVIASNLGEPQRFNHGGNPVEADNPTEHTAIAPSGEMIWVQSDGAGTVTPQGTYEFGTYPAKAPLGGGTGTGTLTVDGPNITINPGPHREVIVKGDNDTVIGDDASITISSGKTTTIVGNGNSVTLEKTSGGTLEMSGTGNTVTSGNGTISVGSGASVIEYNTQQKFTDVVTTFETGSVQEREFDPDNTHPYNELDVAKDATGKVTGAQILLDQSVINAGGAIGQIFGSALGAALGGKDQLTKLASSVVGGTIGSLIGQKFGLVVATSMATDLSKVSLTDVFALQNIDIASAGIGAVSSFLTAELGNALKIPGFGGQLFNAAANGFTLSVLTQVKTSIGAGLTFDGAIAAIDWSAAVSGAIGAEGLNIVNLAGTFLGELLVPAKSHAGAVGGQLLGAIGSFLLPGIGSLLGDILGTVIGDLFGNTPHPAATDLLTQAGDHYGFTHYQVSVSDGGAFSVPDRMADPALGIINDYLGAVKGAAFDHFKQVTLGYQTDPQSSYISGVPGHPAGGVFFAPGYAVQAAALDVLQHTEVIGGDLLLKRAHHNSSFNDPPPVPPGDPNSNGDPGPTGAPIQPTAGGQLAVMSGDLGVAQDYENYLNNREAINALMAANPNSAFTAGWIATFARVNELGLNHASASDFLGGLVGYLDSVAKAGLGAEAANATVKRDGSVIVEVKVANGADVPGSLSAFADHINVTSDAGGQTVQFTIDGGIVASGYHFPTPTASGGDGANDLWFGGDGGQTFNGTAGHDILVGGAGNDTIHGGAGWDFVQGGAGNDTLFGDAGNNILRGGTGNDVLIGGSDNDTYVFAHGDGADTVADSGGLDSLLFGTGVSRADIVVLQSGNNVTVGVKDPAHPGVPFTQLTDQITLTNWFDANGRVENFVFADGSTVNLSAGQAAFDSHQVPFGAALSGGAVPEHSAAGTVVGTVHGFDFAPGAVLTYAMVDGAGGRFTADAATGNIMVVNGALLNYDLAQSYSVTVRTYDQVGHFANTPFTINLIDMPNHAPVLTMPATVINGYAGVPLQVSSWFSAADADNDALTYVFADGTTAANSGQFVLNGTPLGQGAVVSVNAAQLAGLTFVAGAADSADYLSMQLSDSHAAKSADLAFSVHANHEGPFGFDPATTPLANFAIGAGGWSSETQYPRLLADVNGDHMADIVGFGADGVGVALATGNGHFASPVSGTGNFGYLGSAGGWVSEDQYPRLVADVNGDHMADIVGFGADGVIVALATGNGHFASPVSGIANNFAYLGSAGGWVSENQYPRQLADVNGDGMADIVGFGADGVSVALATGNGHFASPVSGIANFGYLGSAGGWASQDQFPRQLADVNGDGMADIVGFGADGVIVSLATGNGHFASPVSGIANTFGYLGSAGGWSSENQYPRLVADVNGDHMADIVGFGADFVQVSLATGNGHFAAPVAGLHNLTPNAGGWASQDLYPRELGDVSGDGMADVIGFGHDGVFAALSNGFHLV